jgi:hypothetical protein
LLFSINFHFFTSHLDNFFTGHDCFSFLLLSSVP